MNKTDTRKNPPNGGKEVSLEKKSQWKDKGDNVGHCKGKAPGNWEMRLQSKSRQ